MTDMKQPEATPQNLYQITGNVADVNTVLIERAELHRLQAENDGLRALASGGIDLFERYSTFKAKCEELEAMLDAVGAGGVGQSIRPAVQADTAQEPGAGIPVSVPTGWKLVPMEPTAAMLDAAFDTEVVHTEWGVDAFVENTAEVYGAMLAAAPEAPAQQKPVAHLPCCGYADTSALKWNPYNSVAQCHNCGQVYAAPNPARHPLTDSQVKELVKKQPAEDLCRWSYGMGIKDAEAAHGITGSQQ